MFYVASLLCLAISCILPVLGNVEKTIFIGPEAHDSYILQQQPSLDNLKVEVLDPSDYILRRKIDPAKPGSLKGTEAWFLLDHLNHRQRYEVRICWAATVSECCDRVDLFTSISFSDC